MKICIDSECYSISANCAIHRSSQILIIIVYCIPRCLPPDYVLCEHYVLFFSPGLNAIKVTCSR